MFQLVEIKKHLLKTVLVLVAVSVLVPTGALAQSVCSRVSIQIDQQLTLERVAFDARLKITNNMPDKALTDIRVDVIIKDLDGNVKNDIFYMRVSSLHDISGVDGTGTVEPQAMGEAHWLIIPSPGAGGTDPAGVKYFVGATLTYTVSGSQEVVSVNPDEITVKPEAQLVLEYFLPFEVIGDNPFTSQVEAPEPFPLAVRVLNDGYGTGSKLKIESAQPKIIDNSQGLLVDFQLLGASVNDSAVVPSLIADIGDLAAKSIATAYWEMISTLSGNWIEFDVSYTHAADLGGELTSLLKETNAHYLVWKVKTNLPGRDDRLDYLADVDRDPDHLPDAIYESEIVGGTDNAEDSITPVSVVAVVSPPARPTVQSPEVTLGLETGVDGWVYARLPDPSNGMLKLLDVIRADGVHVGAKNFWIHSGLDDRYQKKYTVNILDYRADANVTGNYVLVYEQPAEDKMPPFTELIFNGPYLSGEPIYITPETKIIYKARDNDGGSGVEQMFRKIVEKDTNFIPAYPMNITDTGAAELEYYSVDISGNQEPIRTALLYVDGSPPEIVSFSASPEALAPQAPRGIAASRSTEFAIKATDETGAVTGTIQISKGSQFSETDVVKSFDLDMNSGAETRISWDGKDKDGLYVPTGTYTVRLSVSDGLEGGTVSHTSVSDTTVQVVEWFESGPLDPNLSGEQLYPAVSGVKVVWQDKRNGNWDIFLKDASAGASSAVVVSNASDQTRPYISGDIVVWQDMRNGTWDIYGYDISSNSEFTIFAGAGNQERPVVSGQWVAWQDDSAGNWDIYLYHMGTGERTRITSHERDQIYPALTGDTLVWEDYRHGLGEIYTYDLNTGVEDRHTFDIYTQTLPAISNSVIAWTDRRSGQRDIYFSKGAATESRLTYGTGDHSQATVLKDVIVYTDYENGLDDPNLAFFDTFSGIGGRLTSDPHRQEEPALGEGKLLWQDNRDGVFQIYVADFSVESLPLEVSLNPGFNLIAVGQGLADVYQSASDLVASDSGIEKVVTYNSLNGVYLESSPLMDIALKKGMGIGVYASKESVINVAKSGETADYTLLPGINYIGILTVPRGYKASDLLNSIGLDNVQSVRKFNSTTGSWETAAIKGAAPGAEVVGFDFPIHSGEGLIITMKNRVDGWRP